MENAKELPRIGTTLTVLSRYGPMTGTVTAHNTLMVGRKGSSVPKGDAITFKDDDGGDWLVRATEDGDWYAGVPYFELNDPGLMRHVLGNKRRGQEDG